MADSTDIRLWLADNGFDCSPYGRIPTELRDIYFCVEQKLYPDTMSSETNSASFRGAIVAYVGAVRNWAIQKGKSNDRRVMLSAAVYREYATVHSIALVADFVMATSPEPTNLADQKALDAAEAEARAVNLAKYTGLAYVVAQTNLAYKDIIQTSLFEAIKLIDRTFDATGHANENSVVILREAYACVNQGLAAMEIILQTFQPPHEIADHVSGSLPEVSEIIRRSVQENQRLQYGESGEGLIASFVNVDGHGRGIVAAYDAETFLYDVAVVDANTGTKKILKLGRYEFEIID